MRPSRGRWRAPIQPFCSDRALRPRCPAPHIRARAGRVHRGLSRGAHRRLPRPAHQRGGRGLRGLGPGGLPRSRRSSYPTSIEILRDSFAAMLFLFIGGSWRIGNRLAGKGSPGQSRTVAIDEMRLPYPLIWAFLASWVLGHGGGPRSRRPSAPPPSPGIARLRSACRYAAQGLGVLTHLFKSWNMPKSLRIGLTPVMAVMALATPTIGVVA